MACKKRFYLVELEKIKRFLELAIKISTLIKLAIEIYQAIIG